MKRPLLALVLFFGVAAAQIGEPSARLDALLEQEGATTAAFVTAANPRSKKKTAAENASAPT